MSSSNEVDVLFLKGKAKLTMKIARLRLRDKSKWEIVIENSDLKTNSPNFDSEKLESYLK